MKKCPHCGLHYSDDNLFCVTDGATLIAQSDSVLRDEPTQVFQRTSPQPIVNQSTGKWLYLVIGVLATALVGLGVILYVNRGKDEKREANNGSNLKTEYKTVTPESSNQAKNASPVNIPTAPANVAADARLSPGGNWAGDWSSPSGAYLTIKLNLNDDGSGNVQGQIEWTLQRTNRPEKMSKIGMTAIEYVRGRYDPVSRNLTMSGYRKDDPNNVLVMVDNYRLVLAADDRNLNGAARNGGKWDGRVRLQRN